MFHRLLNVTENLLKSVRVLYKCLSTFPRIVLIFQMPVGPFGRFHSSVNITELLLKSARVLSKCFKIS